MNIIHSSYKNNSDYEINSDVNSDVLKQKIRNLNIIKMILMLSVVLCHSVSFWSGNWFSVIKPSKTLEMMTFISKWTGSFHVYAFTFISGYLFYYLKIEMLKYKSYKEFVINKVKRLIIPYCFISIFWVIPITQYYYNYSASEISMNYLLAVNPSQLWFLLMLFWVYILFYPFSTLFDKKPIIGIVLVILSYGIGLICNRYIPNVLNLFSGFEYITFFYVGFLFRKIELQLSRSKKIFNSLPIIIVCIIHFLLFFVSYKFHFSGIILYGLIYLTHIFGSISAFVLLQRILLVSPQQASKIHGIPAGDMRSEYLSLFSRSAKASPPGGRCSLR